MSKLVNVDAVIDEIEKHKQYMRDKMPNEKLAELYFLAHEHIKELILLKVPSAEEEYFEWCDGCKEYDQEQHCCHRFTKVIRQTVAEMKLVHCIDCQHSEYDEVYGDRYCHYNGKAEVVDDYHYCRDGEKRDDDVTCENCEYSEKYTDGLILCRRTKTSHRVSATSTCGKGKRKVEDAEAKI